MSKLAFLFPGQGSQSAGMGRLLAEQYPEAKAVFQEADGVLGFPLSSICFEGSEEDLKPTEIAQPALLACSIAALRCVQAAGYAPRAAAGHSLGEYSALVCAGALPFAQAVLLVRRRGELMAEAGRSVKGSMAAVLGLTGEQVSTVCASVDGVVVPANLNAPGQVVISGEAAAVEAAAVALKAAGASRVIPLQVSGAFHSPLIAEAAEKMREELSKVQFETAAIPVVSNATAAPVQRPEELREALVLQMSSGVRWEEGVRRLQSMGITHFLEIGPGRVLSGLVRKILGDAFTYNVGDPSGVQGLRAFAEL